MSSTLFPSLLLPTADPLWFDVDKPCDDENELTKLEEQHQTWLQSIATKGQHIVPIGKNSSEHAEDDDDVEDEEDDEAVDDESDTNDDDEEMDTDMIDDRDSPDEAEVGFNGGNADSPTWGM